MNIQEKLTEIDEVDFVTWMTPIILESITTCPEEDVEYYKTLTFDDYYDSIVEEIWDGNESFGEGISFCCSNALLVTDDNKDYVENLFNIARDDAWKRYCEDCRDEQEDAQEALSTWVAKEMNLGTIIESSPVSNEGIDFISKTKSGEIFSIETRRSLDKNQTFYLKKVVRIVSVVECVKPDGTRTTVTTDEPHEMEHSPRAYVDKHGEVHNVVETWKDGEVLVNDEIVFSVDDLE